LQLNKRLGRATTAVLLDAAGTATLFSMSIHSNTLWTNVILFQVRTAALNAGYPTQRAILMDVVPKSDRGKWNALESVTTFTWTGSAALGGLLITTHDYRFTFMITGILYVLATALLALLIPLTYGEKVEDVQGAKTAKTVLVAQAAQHVSQDFVLDTSIPSPNQISPGP
jgi:MFS family permease